MADDCVKEKESENPASVSQKKVLVRNLPLSTNNQDLENVFTEIGPILNAFVARNKGQTEGCRGFGFVVFAHVEDAEKAVNTVTTLHGRQLVLCFANKKPKREKRKLKQGEKAVDDGDDKHAKDEQNNKEIAKDVYSENQEPAAKKFKGEKKSKSQRKNEANELGRTVEITGLTYGLKPDHIQKRCGKIGKVEKVTFPVEGREKATAFVVFESRKDATEVVTKLSGRIFKGKTINAVLLSREGKAPSQESPRKSRLIVRNLSFKCKPEKLRVFFSKFGQVKNVYIPKKSDGERKHNAGFGFVQFSNVFEAARAIKESNTKKIFGRPIAVDWAVRQRVYEKKALDKGRLPLESFRLSKTNKAIRLEKKEKRRETPQRKREAKKKRKLGQTMEGHPDESNQTKDLNRRRRKTANERTWKEIKGRQNCPPKVPVARKLVKNGQQERKQVSRVSLGARKSDMSTHSAEASPASNKRKLESSKKRLSKNVPETGGSSSLFANGAGNLVNKSEKEQE